MIDQTTEDRQCSDAWAAQSRTAWETKCGYKAFRLGYTTTWDTSTYYHKAYKRLYVAGQHARQAADDRSYIAALSHDVVWVVKSFLGDTPDACNGARMRAIMWGWRIDWSKSADKLDEEARQVIRNWITSAIELMQSRNRVEYDRYCASNPEYGEVLETVHAGLPPNLRGLGS